MRRFNLVRDEDVSGVSGTGTVAEGVLFDNGKAVLAWLVGMSTLGVYDNMDQVQSIHGHEGKTRIVWVDGYDALLPLTILDGRGGFSWEATSAEHHFAFVLFKNTLEPYWCRWCLVAWVDGTVCDTHRFAQRSVAVARMNAILQQWERDYGATISSAFAERGLDLPDTPF